MFIGFEHMRLMASTRWPAGIIQLGACQWMA